MLEKRIEREEKLKGRKSRGNIGKIGVGRRNTKRNRKRKGKEKGLK